MSSINVDFIGDERVWILFDTERGVVMAREMDWVDKDDPGKGKWECYAAFDSLADANECRRTIPERIRGSVEPQERMLREVLANAIADGGRMVGVAVFDGKGKRIKRVVKGV